MKRYFQYNTLCVGQYFCCVIMQPNRCLRATTSVDQSAILIAESREARDQWLSVLRHIVGDVTEDVAKEYPYCV